MIMTINRKDATDIRDETEKDPRWSALMRKDRSADGSFFYGVKTTGVFCRPSCAARPAKAENIS